MISIILTAWKEERTIGEALGPLIAQSRALPEKTEIILVCPDEATYRAAMAVVDRLNLKNFLYIKDPRKGKPHALNCAMEKAQGKIIVSTDGDVRIGEGALSELIKPFREVNVGGVTGRPLCVNSKTTLWGYWGHLFMDAAHKKRLETLGKGEFYAMSGYLLAFRNVGLRVPDGVLDDVYFSHELVHRGFVIAYAKNAEVYVKQPSNSRDWLAQKVRSLSGYQDSFNGKKEIKKSRTICGDLRYLLYPLAYAKTVKELWWSIVLYPFRLYTWLVVWWRVRILGKRSTEMWERTESTK